MRFKILLPERVVGIGIFFTAFRRCLDLLFEAQPNSALLQSQPIAIALYPAYLSLFIVAFGSREFCDSIRGNEIKLLVAAIKLRNEVLYRAYMTLLMGPWTMPKDLCIKDKKLEQLAALVHHNIFCKVLRTQHNVSQGIVEFGGPHFARIYQREELEAMTS